MSMVISRHSPIISWGKQSANFQSFTELDRGVFRITRIESETVYIVSHMGLPYLRLTESDNRLGSPKRGVGGSNPLGDGLQSVRKC